MKFNRTATHRKTHALPQLRFEEQQPTSFAGLVVVQQLFVQLDFKQRLRSCFRHLGDSSIYGHPSVVLLLVVHLLLGYRELRDMRYYRDDPLVRRLLGLSQLPDVATVSRALAGADDGSADKLRALLGEIVLMRMAALGLKRVTLDFDGSVIGTNRYAEGTAVGFNRNKKGQRSYYPLFCTVAQTAQVLDVLPRSGNVHDSNGAQAFIAGCIAAVGAGVAWTRGVVISSDAGKPTAGTRTGVCSLSAPRPDDSISNPCSSIFLCPMTMTTSSRPSSPTSASVRASCSSSTTVAAPRKGSLPN